MYDVCRKRKRNQPYLNGSDHHLCKNFSDDIYVTISQYKDSLFLLFIITECQYNVSYYH